MKENGKKYLLKGIVLLTLFCIWTYMIQSVNLLEYSDATAFNRTMYFVLFISLILIGIIMTVSTLIGKNRFQSIFTKGSIIVSVITILFTILARDPYPAVFAFILLMIKLVIIWDRIGTAKA